MYVACATRDRACTRARPRNLEEGSHTWLLVPPPVVVFGMVGCFNVGVVVLVVVVGVVVWYCCSFEPIEPNVSSLPSTIVQYPMRKH